MLLSWAGLVDHLPVQPVVMMFAAKHLGIPFIDYTRDGQKMAAAQSKLVHDFSIDCLLTCSDPAREVIEHCGGGKHQLVRGPRSRNLRGTRGSARQVAPENLPNSLPARRRPDA